MQFIKNTIVCIRHRHTSAILCKRKNVHVGKSSLTTDWLSLRVHYYIRKYTDAVDVTRWQVYTLRRDRAFQRVKTRGSPLLLPNSFFFFFYLQLLYSARYYVLPRSPLRKRVSLALYRMRKIRGCLSLLTSTSLASRGSTLHANG